MNTQNHGKTVPRDQSFSLLVVCERFETRSHFISRLSLIVQENAVLNRIVVVDSD